MFASNKVQSCCGRSKQCGLRGANPRNNRLTNNQPLYFPHSWYSRIPVDKLCGRSTSVFKTFKRKSYTGYWKSMDSTIYLLTMKQFLTNAVVLLYITINNKWKKCLFKHFVFFTKLFFNRNATNHTIMLITLNSRHFY